MIHRVFASIEFYEKFSKSCIIEPLTCFPIYARFRPHLYGTVPSTQQEQSIFLTGTLESHA